MSACPLCISWSVTLERLDRVRQQEHAEKKKKRQTDRQTQTIIIMHSDNDRGKEKGAEKDTGVVGVSPPFLQAFSSRRHPVERNCRHSFYQRGGPTEIAPIWLKNHS